MKKGKVYLVGAGPGDPGLLTVRGLHLLHAAEVVLYDRLVNTKLLDETPPDAQHIFVGKHAGSHSLSQEEINSLLISQARAGRLVVRLKGGDPFVFGRGGEEVEALRKARILYEVVPGVSSAVAVPAYAGIPLTHRSLASSFAVVTGHETSKAKASVNWGKLAGSVDTLVILMGLKNFPDIARELINHGQSPKTPVAAIRWGTTEEQEIVIGTLDNIHSRMRHLRPPVVIVVGKVAGLAAELSWFVPQLRELALESESYGQGFQFQPARL